MNVRDSYWAMLVTLKNNEAYCNHYLVRSKRINGVITGFCSLFSAASIATWAWWEQVPIIWGSIVILLQVVQILSPIMPFSKQITALKFMNAELSSLLLSVESDWRKLKMYSDDDINYLMDDYKKRRVELGNKYIDDIYMPTSKYCERKAENDCFIYFRHHYNTQGVSYERKRQTTRA